MHAQSNRVGELRAHTPKHSIYKISMTIQNKIEFKAKIGRAMKDSTVMGEAGYKNRAVPYMDLK